MACHVASDVSAKFAQQIESIPLVKIITRGPHEMYTESIEVLAKTRETVGLRAGTLQVNPGLFIVKVY